MQRAVAGVAVIVVVGLGSAWGMLATPSHGTTPQPAYTPLQLYSALHHGPSDWRNRTVLVRAVAVVLPCPPATVPCGAQSFLADADPANGLQLWPVHMQQPMPVLTDLRQVPLLGRLLGHRQTLHWGNPATYRVRLQPQPGCPATLAACYELLLRSDPS